MKLSEVKVKEEMMGKFEKWKVEDALRDLMRAEEIEKDAELMKQVQKLAKDKKKMISSIADLKDAYNEMEED